VISVDTRFFHKNYRDADRLINGKDNSLFTTRQASNPMGDRTGKLRNELNLLFEEQIECLKKETFGVLSEDEIRSQTDRLKRIRELSADYIAALRRDHDMKGQP
jgi:hypothetical protein